MTLHFNGRSLRSGLPAGSPAETVFRLNQRRGQDWEGTAFPGESRLHAQALPAQQLTVGRTALPGLALGNSLLGGISVATSYLCSLL